MEVAVAGQVLLGVIRLLVLLPQVWAVLALQTASPVPQSLMLEVVVAVVRVLLPVLRVVLAAAGLVVIRAHRMGLQEQPT